MNDFVRAAIRFHSELSDLLYSDSRPIRSGADPIDGEYHRLVASVMRTHFAASDPTPATIADAIADFRRQWFEFAAANNAKVNAAPKIKDGPSSGHSCISHRWACPSKADQAAIDIGHLPSPGGPRSDNKAAPETAQMTTARERFTLHNRRYARNRDLIPSHDKGLNRIIRFARRKQWTVAAAREMRDFIRSGYDDDDGWTCEWEDRDPEYVADRGVSIPDLLREIRDYLRLDRL